MKRGVPRGWGAGMPKVDGGWGGNGSATTHLDSALISASNLQPVRNAKTRDVTLQQGGYLCPRCDGFNLCFESYWDDRLVGLLRCGGFVTVQQNSKQSDKNLCSRFP